VCGGEIDLEWASNGLLISKVLEETGVVLRASANQVHRVSVGCTELDILAAVKERTSKVRTDVEIDRLDASLTGACILGRRHLNERPLVGMAGECTKELPEVVLARRTGSNHELCSSDVIA
jgi:hypothetical protein